MPARISYGKAQVSVYRTYGTPMSGVTVIPESRFSGVPNMLFAVEVEVEVFGDNFMPAYTEGDNSNVVATDTMKNFILYQALHYTGSTLEGFLYFLGMRFLAEYPQMGSLRVAGRELPFEPAVVPAGHEGVLSESGVLFNRTHDGYGIATLWLERDDSGQGVRVTGHECGCVDLQMIKVTGSSFASFARDAHTTLPERKDRPLFIYLDVRWRYSDPAAITDGDLARYISTRQVRDFVGATFHSFVSMSIQHLVHEIGVRLMTRFPQVEQVSFKAQNRLWDIAFEADDGKAKVYTDPRPPYGSITLTLDREG
ncbi:MAG: urate oxidase [Chloroflexia bacterium]